MKNKKPTMNEVKDAINNIIMHLGEVNKKINEMDFVTENYIEYKKDSDKFKKFATKKIKEISDAESAVRSSVKGDKEASPDK